jgi:hypothetical protein
MNSKETVNTQPTESKQQVPPKTAQPKAAASETVPKGDQVSSSSQQVKKKLTKTKKIIKKTVMKTGKSATPKPE